MVYLDDLERRDHPESLAKLLICLTSRAYVVSAQRVFLVRPVSQDSPEIKATRGPQGRVDKMASRVRLDQLDLKGLLELMALRASKETEVQLVLPETKEIRVTLVPLVTPAPPASWDQLAQTDSQALLVHRGPLEKRARRVSKESKDHQAFQD